MSSNWVNALDACAASGVIDYDAPSFILGRNPRYVGHPEFEKLPLKNDCLLPPGIKLNDLPAIDSYNNSEDRPLVENPAWKKVLFGAIVLASLIAGSIGFAKFGKLKMPDMGKISSNITNIAKKSWQYTKKTFEFLMSKIRK